MELKSLNPVDLSNSTIIYFHYDQKAPFLGNLPGKSDFLINLTSKNQLSVSLAVILNEANQLIKSSFKSHPLHCYLIKHICFACVPDCLYLLDNSFLVHFLVPPFFIFRLGFPPCVVCILP